MTYREIKTAADAEAIRSEIEAFVDEGWDRDGTAFEWENWLDRIEGELGLDLGSDTESEGFRAIKRIARKAAQ